jgi:hypothetical protein
MIAELSSIFLVFCYLIPFFITVRIGMSKTHTHTHMGKKKSQSLPCPEFMVNY